MQGHDWWHQLTTPNPWAHPHIFPEPRSDQGAVPCQQLDTATNGYIYKYCLGKLRGVMAWKDWSDRGAFEQGCGEGVTRDLHVNLRICQGLPGVCFKATGICAFQPWGLPKVHFRPWDLPGVQGLPGVRPDIWEFVHFNLGACQVCISVLGACHACISTLGPNRCGECSFVCINQGCSNRLCKGGQAGEVGGWGPAGRGGRGGGGQDDAPFLPLVHRQTCYLLGVALAIIRSTNIVQYRLGVPAFKMTCSTEDAAEARFDLLVASSCRVADALNIVLARKMDIP
eukprot:1158780-Pelagomonas_calceolata.AAC.12